MTVVFFVRDTLLTAKPTPRVTSVTYSSTTRTVQAKRVLKRDEGWKEVAKKFSSTGGWEMYFLIIICFMSLPLFPKIPHNVRIGKFEFLLNFRESLSNEQEQIFNFKNVSHFLFVA